MLEYLTGDKIFESFLFITILYLPSAIVFWLVLRVDFLNKILSYPIDCNLKFRQRPLFGKNKTWRSPISMGFGVLLGLLGVKNFIGDYEYLFDYINNLLDKNLVFISLLIGLGGECGELVNSFFKRQLDVRPGQQGNQIQHFFDQVDIFIAVVLVMSVFIKPVPIYFITWGIVEIYVLHILFTFVVKRILKIKT